MKIFRYIILITLLALTTFLANNIYHLETQKRYLKKDLIELSKIQYGLFNVDKWKTTLADILTKKIQEFKVDESNRTVLQSNISKFLYKAIDEFEKNYKENNIKSSWYGSITNYGARLFEIFPKLKENVPSITNNIIDYLNKPENKETIRQFILSKLNESVDKTFNKVDYSSITNILSKYGYIKKADAIANIKLKIDDIKYQNQKFIFPLFIIIFIIAFSIIYLSNITKIEFLIFITISLLLLFLGIKLPMIDIDARISKMSFQLLGETITYTNQILYYKSKSILEVVELMLMNGKAKLFFVGLLILAFSVLFPLFKLIASIIYLFSIRLRHNKLINFMVFKIGKWSMADVMVVAIFMAYLGFSGILSEQLGELQKLSNNIDILTTNNSTLQIGFFLFTSFVVISLLISHKLKSSLKN